MADDTIGKRIRKGAYGLVKLVKDEAQIVGKAIGEGLEAAGKKLGGAVDRVKEIHDEIQEQGGYLEPVRKTWRETRLRTLAAYKDLEDACTTDGECDAEKIKGLLKDKGQTIARFGQRTYDRLSKLVTEGIHAIREDYERFIPSEEELMGKYKGIGTLNREIMFRDQYEACLVLCLQMRTSIPKRTKYRAQLLKDARSYGSEKAVDLRDIYLMQQTNDLINQRTIRTGVQEKMRILEKYFKM